jgi:hypothetical protein
MGWPEVVRFWLPAWIHDRATLLEKIDTAVARAATAQAAAAEAAAAAEFAAAAAAGAAAAAAIATDPTDGAVIGPTAVSPDAAPSRKRATVAGRRNAGAATRSKGASRTTPARQPAREQVLVASLDAPPAPAPEIGTDRRPGAGPVAFVPYQPTAIGTQADIDAIATDQRVRRLVRNSLRDIIAAEGPIEQHRLARLTLARFGFVKSREDRRNAVLALLEAGVLRHHDGIGSFAWPAGLDPRRWNGFRTTRSRTDRAFEEIAPEEIANAVRYALTSTPDMTEQELFRATLELLGYQRRTEKITKLLRYGLLEALTSGRVVHGGRGTYRLS